MWFLQAYVEDLKIFVDDTIREIEEVKKQKPDTPMILMGHSMGGLIACMVALKRPDLISGSCLSAPCLKVSSHFLYSLISYFNMSCNCYLPLVIIVVLILFIITKNPMICTIELCF